MIADRYDAFLFDLDGVLYRGAEPIDGAAETLATLRSLRKRLAFLTNNSSRTPEAIAAHLTGMGIRAALVTAGLTVVDRSAADAETVVVG
jgi:ribonucleotide monophosphatase NagD (HAD superfamily)